MTTRRIVYVITLACSVAFYALYPFWFSWYLFVMILLLIPFDLLSSLPGMCTKRVALTTPKITERGAHENLVITTYQNKAFPAGYIKIKLLAAQDGNIIRQRIKCDPERGSRYEVAIDTLHSGLTVFEIKRIHTTSMFGLFSLVVSINCKASVLILPEPIKPPRTVSLPRGVILRPKTGGGFSEDNELRPYRKGDPIRIIHWKLSAKHDSLIIREPLIPPHHSRLIKIEKWTQARERDIIIGRFRWISDYLLKWDFAYYVKFGDNGPVAEINCANDFLEYLYCILDHSEQIAQVSVALPARFSWVFRIDAREGNAE